MQLRLLALMATLYFTLMALAQSAKEIDAQLADLAKRGEHVAAAEAATRAAIWQAENVGRLQKYQKLVVQSWLAAAKPAVALSHARSLYNVATMDGTADAIALVAECLAAARPEDPGIVARFKLEQLAGSSIEPTTQPARQTVLESIGIDPAPYQPAIDKLVGQDFATLNARGNLLLLAGKPDEAMKAFEQAYAIATDRQLAQASENIARAMRAQDGSVGRANAWVLSIRPE